MSDSHQIPITDEMIALAWNAMRPSHRLRGIEAHEAAEMKAAISAALGAVLAVAVPMAEAWELSAADTEQRAEGAGQDYNQGVAEGLRICAKDLRAALDATPAAVQTHAEAAAALGINSALTRIRAGNHAEAIEPLEHALRALAAAPSAELIAATITHHFRYTGGSMGSNDELRVQEAVKYALSATKAADELDESREDLFWKLHSLSKSLESRGLIDQHDQPEAYAAILDAMKLVRQGAAAAPVVLPEPVAFALEWTFDGEERGIRLYDDERHCRLDAESDGGVCSPLYTEQQVRAQLATATGLPAPQEPIAVVTKFHDLGGEIDWTGRAIAPVGAKLYLAPQAQDVGRGEVLVTVSGFTGSGKSAIAGEIEILCRALGLQVEWPDGESEKNMTHADWTAALEQYKPRVRIVEQNIPFVSKKGLSK